jgi:hypothetical protein
MVCGGTCGAVVVVVVVVALSFALVAVAALSFVVLGRIPWPPREISGEEAQARTRVFWA